MVHVNDLRFAPAIEYPSSSCVFAVIAIAMACVSCRWCATEWAYRGSSLGLFAPRWGSLLSGSHAAASSSSGAHAAWGSPTVDHRSEIGGHLRDASDIPEKFVSVVSNLVRNCCTDINLNWLVLDLEIGVEVGGSSCNNSNQKPQTGTGARTSSTRTSSRAVPYKGGHLLRFQRARSAARPCTDTIPLSTIFVLPLV